MPQHSNISQGEGPNPETAVSDLQQNLNCGKRVQFLAIYAHHILFSAQRVILKELSITCKASRNIV